MHHWVTWILKLVETVSIGQCSTQLNSDTYVALRMIEAESSRSADDSSPEALCHIVFLLREALR